MRSRTRAGFTMIETLMFLGILAIMGTVIIGVMLATQDARVRQQGIASLEQRGTQVLESMTRRIRRAEAVLYPTTGNTGSMISLQMAMNAEHPTIFTSSGTNLMLIEKTDESLVFSGPVAVTNLLFRNVSGGSVTVSFDLVATLQLPHPQLYRRHFEGNVTLFPDDQSESGGCGTCPVVTCKSHLYRWYYCANDVCTQSDDAISC
ncbi:MAG TPA: type II secretion system protein [Candidatus Peribacteria bacterium]|nr:type II secretion system protein [Candidatus Peribacteria bacterium]